MNRASRVLRTAVLSFTWFMAGCGGGPTGTIIPPPPPPPSANPVPAITSNGHAVVRPGWFSWHPYRDRRDRIHFQFDGSMEWGGTSDDLQFGNKSQRHTSSRRFNRKSASSITVQNPAPGGGTSAGATFNVNSPVAVITAISPRYVPPGSPATITVTGTGFESNSIVMWNAAARPTTFVSATSLQVALSAADLQNQGTGSLTVSNTASQPDPLVLQRRWWSLLSPFL